MLDLKFIKENLELVARNNQERNIKVDLKRLITLADKKNLLLQTADSWRSERNKLSRTKPTSELIEKLKFLGKKIAEHDSEIRLVEEEIISLLYQIPNIRTIDTPVGSDAQKNKVLRRVGEIPNFDFTPKDHVHLGKIHDLIDTETSAKVTGARFNYLKNQAVILQLALIRYAFDILTSKDKVAEIIKTNNLKLAPQAFKPVIPPYMIKPEVYEKMARLKYGDEDKYHLPKDDLYLIGSAEHTLGPIFIDQILSANDLPQRFIGLSPAFRREAGSYGRDTKGILRVHQFDKLEIEIFSLPENSLLEQDLIVACQEYLLQSLKLPYQVVLICTGDMGLPDARQIDIETWLPGQNLYRETHTADLMTDYQARRLNTRVKRENGQIEFIHMNDGTVFAIGRMLIAILENYQQKDGSILIPEILRSYTSFDKIS